MEAVGEAVEGGRVFEALRLLADQPAQPELHGALSQQAAECNLALGGLEESAEWKCALAEPEVGHFSVHYQHEPPYHSVRYAGTYECDCSALLAVGRETDLLSSWNKYCTASALLATPSALQCTGYGEVWLPWPYYNRRMTVGGRLIDLMNDPQHCVLVLLSSEPDQAKYTLPESAASCVHCGLGPGSCIKLEPTSDGRTTATMLLHLDLDMPRGASSVMRLLLKVMSPWVQRRLMQVVADAKYEHNEYRQRIQLNRALYGLLDRRCDATIPPVAPFSERAPEVSLGDKPDEGADDLHL